MNMYLLSGCVLLLMSSAAHAEIDIGEFKAAKAKGGVEWDAIRLYVNGVGNGFATANAMLQSDNRALLYCQPSKLALQADNYVQMIEAQIAQYKPKADMTLTVTLIYALQSTFPCPAK